jgi:hypothetical protein
MRCFANFLILEIWGWVDDLVSPGGVGGGDEGRVVTRQGRVFVVSNEFTILFYFISFRSFSFLIN